MKKLSALVALGLAAVLTTTASPRVAASGSAPAVTSAAATSAAPAGPVAAGAQSSTARAAKQAKYKPEKSKPEKPKRWEVYRGPFFNDPHGGPKANYAIERRVLDTLAHVKRGETVRIALYSFDREPVANAIIAAYRRGVKIQMLLNDHQDTRAMKMVRAVIGGNRWARSFIYTCHWGCRSLAEDDRNLHSKFYTFTKAGRSKDVLAVGSHNFTLNADKHQWNDLYFLSGNEALFDQFVATFKDMKKDYETGQPPMRYCGIPVGAQCDDSVDKYTNWVFPKRSTAQDDLVLTMLNRIQCLTPDGAGNQVRTRLELSMHTMRGRRGNYLASAIRQKFAEGCDVRVSYGLIGYQTKKILGASTARGRIPLRSTGLDYNPDDNFDLNNDGDDDLILDFYTHQKYFVIDGTYNGVPNTKMVLTGSSNWASLGTAQDEVFFTVHGGATVRKYQKNFEFMWTGKGNSRPAYTTTYSDFRVARLVRSPDGASTTRYVTVRRPITSVTRDGYRAGGSHWEGD